MLEVLLIGFGTNILTWIAGKLNWSKTYVAMATAIVIGTVYYIVTNYYAVAWQEIVTFVGGVYAASQLIYGLMKKSGMLKKLGLDSKKE